MIHKPTYTKKSDLALGEPQPVDEEHPEKRNEEAKSHVEEKRRQKDRPQLRKGIGARDVADAPPDIEAHVTNVLVRFIELREHRKRVHAARIAANHNGVAALNHDTIPGSASVPPRNGPSTNPTPNAAPISRSSWCVHSVV
jgi:hypothetical protein